GVGTWHGQLSPQTAGSAASAAHWSSHCVSQQNASTPHTHDWQVASLQPGPKFPAQQLPGVGVGVGGGAPPAHLSVRIAAPQARDALKVPVAAYAPVADTI